MGGVMPFVMKPYTWVVGAEKIQFLALHDY